MVAVPEKIALVVSFGATGRPARISLIIEEGNPTVYEAAPKSPAKLGEYVGNYYSEELDTTYALTVESNKLVVGKRRG